MSVPVRLRRPLVVLGVILSLIAGATTIRAAAAWTAADSPLVAKPPSVESLQAVLAIEQARSGALQVHLDELMTGSTDLEAALDAARERIAADTTEADALQASLTAAKAKLAALEKSIRRSAAKTAAARAPVPAAVTARSDEAEHEEDHEEGGDD